MITAWSALPALRSGYKDSVQKLVMGSKDDKETLVLVDLPLTLEDPPVSKSCCHATGSNNSILFTAATDPTLKNAVICEAPCTSLQ